MPLHIRQIQAADNKLLADLIKAVFVEFNITHYPGTVYHDPSTNNLSQLFENPAATAYYVAEEDGILLGGCGIYPTDGLPDGCAELVKFYLSPQSRGKGIGLKLMNLCLEKAKKLGYKEVYLESFAQLGNAVGMYEKAGFQYLPNALGNSGHYSCTIWMMKSL